MEKVEIEILDDTGHTTLQLVPALAMRKLRKEASEGKWVYIDGEPVHKTICTLRPESLVGIREIKVTEPQIGG